MAAQGDYRHLYDRRAWRRTSKAQLSRKPLCRECLAIGRITAATQADHIIPHMGDPGLFWHGELQSLCYRCHQWKTSMESNQFSRRHLPDIKPPACGFVVVCGPPAAGKTGYCRERMQPGDILIDWDEIRYQLSGKRWDWTQDEANAATRERNRMLHSLEHEDPAITAYMPTLAPHPMQRQHWRDLGAEIVVIECDRAECERRIRKDPHRRSSMRLQQKALDAYFGPKKIQLDGAPEGW